MTELFHSFITALNIKTQTQTRMPAKALLTTGASAKPLRTAAIIVMMISAGQTVPSAATIPPNVPLRFCPINIMVLTMMIPGRH